MVVMALVGNVARYVCMGLRRPMVLLSDAILTDPARNFCQIWKQAV